MYRYVCIYILFSYHISINAKPIFVTFSYIIYMVLTWQVPEIEVYISEHREFPLVIVQVWHKEPGNYTCTIPLPRNYYLLVHFGTSFKFWGQEVCKLFC